MEKIIHDFATEVRMTDEEAKEICRMGKGGECCAFLTMSTNGFECIKMSYPLNSSIHQRLEEGSMNAKGEGGWKGCPWNEEKEEVKKE